MICLPREHDRKIFKKNDFKKLHTQLYSHKFKCYNMFCNICNTLYMLVYNKSSNVIYHMLYSICQNKVFIIQRFFVMLQYLGMSCPSWQWHRTGSRWSPVRTLPVAPLWCDLGFVPNSRGNKAAANLCPMFYNKKNILHSTSQPSSVESRSMYTSNSSWWRLFKFLPPTPTPTPHPPPRAN